MILEGRFSGYCAQKEETMAEEDGRNARGEISQDSVYGRDAWKETEREAKKKMGR